MRQYYIQIMFSRTLICQLILSGYLLDQTYTPCNSVYSVAQLLLSDIGLQKKEMTKEKDSL